MITWNNLELQTFNCDLPNFKKRIEKSLIDISTKGTISVNRREVVTGYAYGELYDWDLYFENIFLSYFGISQYCRNGVETFLDTQEENGFISRTMGKTYSKPRQHFKPFLAQTALLGCRQENDFKWLEERYYKKLKKYLEYWTWYCDIDKNGLVFWDGSDHSGMDNQSSRLGFEGVMEFEGIDLNCYLVREFEAMAQIAEAIGCETDIIYFKEKAQFISSQIDNLLWDDETEFYYDRSEKTGELNMIKCISGFFPMWLGTISKERAEILVRKHLLNEKEFWTEYPVATWAKDQKGYHPDCETGICNWMGATWIPTNYIIIQGLLNYGYDEIAFKIAEKTFQMIINEPEIREFYNSRNGSGLGLNPFWGWSTLGFVLPYEVVNKYSPTNLKPFKFKNLGQLT